jgi:hypothetical protein
MENLFERVLFGGVLEDYRAKCGPIQVAIAGKDTKAEKIEQLLFDLVKIDQFPGDLIGVEKLGSGKDLAQTIAESALARGNPPGDPNRRHDLKSFCDPDCGHVTVCPV